MRDMNDFSGVLREGLWVAGCVAVATLFCYYRPEYGASPVPFFSGCLYLLSWLVRLAYRALRRLSHRPQPPNL